jgi:DNA-binding response OmpR family regulator
MSAAHHVPLSELHVQAFFAKPFDLDELLDMIDELLVAHPASQHSRAN